MTSERNEPGNAAELRLRAEKSVGKRTDLTPASLEALSPEEARHLLHEMQVHQIELEMQNEELRLAQAELEAARARYFDLYDLAPVGYLTVNERNLILEANLSAASLLSTARAEMVKQPITRFIFREDRDLYYRHRKNLFETGEPQTCELRMVRKDDAICWVRMEAAAAQNVDGESVCRVVLSDATEHKRIEEAQLFLLQCGYSGEDFFKTLAKYLAGSLAMDYVCIDRLEGDGLSAQTVAVYYDGRFEDNVSYTLKDTPCGDVVGKTICCYPKGVRHLFPKDVVLQEISAESYVGTTLWNYEGKPIGLIAVIGRKPLTAPRIAESLLKLVAIRAAGELERGQAEDALCCLMETLECRVEERTRELLEANASLERSTTKLRNLTVELIQAEERERKRLAAVLHDHLQQFLVAAKFKVGMIQRRAPNESRTRELQEVLDLLGEAIGASRSLTADLCPPVLWDGDLMEGLRRLGQRMKKNHGLTVEVTGKNIPGIHEPLSILLFQAVRELLLNVVKHAGVDQSSVHVSQQYPTSIKIVVADQGVGFTENTSEGFGLFHLRERLSYIGGTLDVTSTRGHGAQVSVMVPFGEAPASSTASSTSEIPEQVSSSKARSEMRRILIVDDHAVMRQGLVELLGKEIDIAVIGIAVDGDQAIQTARNLLPDVILMDVSMPGMNGIDATRIIKAEMPEIQVIGLSMHERGDMSSRMREAGAVAYLQKDGPVEDLISAIRSLPPHGRTA